MNCGKIIYFNVGQCTCNSNKPKTVTRALEIREHTPHRRLAANGMRKCRPGKRCHRRLFALARPPRYYYYYYVSSWRVGLVGSLYSVPLANVLFLHSHSDGRGVISRRWRGYLITVIGSIRFRKNDAEIFELNL